jgi:hypothetical protein
MRTFGSRHLASVDLFAEQRKIPKRRHIPARVAHERDAVEIVHSGAAERAVAGGKSRRLDDVRLATEATKTLCGFAPRVYVAAVVLACEHFGRHAAQARTGELAPGEEMSTIKKRKIAKGIYLLQFKTQYELAATFLRVQEHYESPRFHGRIFSLEEFMDWYAERYGNFTYYEDWAGFNVPSTALQPFYQGKFDPLSAKEKKFLRLFEGLRERFYVIGIYDSGKDSLTHELAHALFFVDERYRNAVRKAMRGYDTTKLARQIADAGYARHVVPDEIQAYIISPSGKLRAPPALAPLRQELRALFRRHSKGLSISRIRRTAG